MDKDLFKSATDPNNHTNQCVAATSSTLNDHSHCRCYCHCRWNEQDTQAYRAEVESRFRQRTPAQKILDVDLGNRVNRSEMRLWSIQTLNKELPELDREWGLQQAGWYRQMAKRVIKEQDPASLPAAVKYFKDWTMR